MQLKKIVFEEWDKNHADLILKLRARGLTQKSFFQYIVRAYIDDDRLLDDFFDSLESSRSSLGQRARKKIKDSKRAGQALEEACALTAEERANIFDILEMEGIDS